MKNKKAEPFPPFRAEYTYLPISFDSAHLSCNFNISRCAPFYICITDQYKKKYWAGYIGR
jgi:hypothetical protein